MPQPRSEPRTTFATSVRVFGLDGSGRAVNQLANTVDVSHHGVRITGVQSWEGPGEIIGVRNGVLKARFRIVWVGKPGSPQQGQAGLVCEDTGRFIWQTVPAEAGGPPLSIEEISSDQPTRTPAPRTTGPDGVNRRRDARYLVDGGVQVREMGTPSAQWANVHDISHAGCYIETRSPFPLGTMLEVNVNIGETQFRSRGLVTNCHKLVGMGIRFTEMPPADRERFEALVSSLSQTAQEI